MRGEREERAHGLPVKFWKKCFSWLMVGFGWVERSGTAFISLF